jgi:hypothetical protein
MRLILRHLELILTVAGLLVILGVPRILHVEGYSVAGIAAITAVLVGVLHGLIFWIVRARQRRVREAAFEDIGMMLRDVVRNNLSIIRVGLDSLVQERPDVQQNLVGCEEAVQAISESLNELSEESLRRWNERYPRLEGVIKRAG